MSRLYTTPEAAKLLSLYPETVTNWIKKGVITGTKVGTIFLIPEAEVEKLKEILKKGKYEPFRREVHELEIPRLYKLCANDKFDEVAAELGLPEPPKDVRECYSAVSQVWKRDDKEKDI